MDQETIKKNILTILKKKNALCNIRRKKHYTVFFENIKNITDECQFNDAEIDLIIKHMTASLSITNYSSCFLHTSFYHNLDAKNVFVHKIFKHNLSDSQISRIISTFKGIHYQNIKYILDALLCYHTLKQADLLVIMEIGYPIYDNHELPMNPDMIDSYVHTCLNNGTMSHFAVVQNYVSSLPDNQRQYYVQNIINNYTTRIELSKLKILLKNIPDQVLDGITNFNVNIPHEYLELITQYGYIVTTQTFEQFMKYNNVGLQMYLYCKYNIEFPPNSLDKMLSIHAFGNCPYLLPYADVYNMCITRESTINVTEMKTIDYENYWSNCLITHVQTFRQPNEIAPVKIIQNNDIIISGTSCYTLLRYVTNENPTYETFKLAIENNNYIAIYDYIINYKYNPTVDDLYLIIKHNCYHLLISFFLRYKVVPTVEIFNLLIEKNQINDSIMDRFKDFGFFFPEECVEPFIKNNNKLSSCNLFNYGVEPTEDLYYLAYIYNNNELLRQDWKSDTINNRYHKNHLSNKESIDNYTFDFIHKKICNNVDSYALIKFLKQYNPTKTCYYYGTENKYDDPKLWYKQNNITKEYMMSENKKNT